MVFCLPDQASEFLFPPGVKQPQHLAYVEWFTPFGSEPDPCSLMYKVSRSYDNNGKPLSSIIPVANIQRSVHLIPRFGPVTPRSWSSNTILQDCTTFYVNSFTDRHTYMTVY